MSKAAWRRMGRTAVAVAVLATACTGEQAETSSAPVSVDLESYSDSTGDGTTLAGGLQSEQDGTVLELPTDSNDQLLLIDTHLNGVQAQLIGATFASDGTTLRIRWVNGREFDTTLFGLDDSVLVDSTGLAHDIKDVDLELPEAEVTESELRFGQISSDAGPFTLFINPADDDDGTVDEIAASFELGPFDLADTAPALPAGFGLSDAATHDVGVTLQVFGIGFSDTAIAVNASFANNTTTGSSWASGRYSGFLEDDLGNRYYLELGKDEYRASVDEGDVAAGTLVFAGRVDPAATTLRLVMNDDGKASGRTSMPRFSLGPYPISGEIEAAGVLQPIVASDEFVHPNTSVFTVNGIRFSETGAFVDMVVENSHYNAIRLESGRRTFLLDDLGNTYPILPPADNDNLLIEDDTGFAGEISFPGIIDPAASSIEVIFNDGQDAERDAARSGFPEARFGPYPLARGAAVLGDSPTAFGQRSVMTVGELESTEGEVLGLIFDEFDGIEVPGGVQLTLPEGILFDSGASDLQSGSGDAIDKVTLILEFYEGDAVVIIGHTDDQGSEEFNQQLSIDRANSVVEALIGAGAEQGSLSAEGRGETDAVADNDTDAGRQSNRRVEIMVNTTKGLPN